MDSLEEVPSHHPRRLSISECATFSIGKSISQDAIPAQTHCVLRLGRFALTVGVLTFVPVRIPEYGTLQEIAYQAAFHCPTGQKAQLACSAAGSLRLVNLSQAWAFLLAITWFSTLAPILPHNCTGNHSQILPKKPPCRPSLSP